MTVQFTCQTYFTSPASALTPTNHKSCILAMQLNRKKHHVPSVLEKNKTTNMFAKKKKNPYGNYFLNVLPTLTYTHSLHTKKHRVSECIYMGIDFALSCSFYFLFFFKLGLNLNQIPNSTKNQFTGRNQCRTRPPLTITLDKSIKAI